jgi:hypothetical protein
MGNCADIHVKGSGSGPLFFAASPFREIQPSGFGEAKLFSQALGVLGRSRVASRAARHWLQTNIAMPYPLRSMACHGEFTAERGIHPAQIEGQATEQGGYCYKVVSDSALDVWRCAKT